MFGKKLPNGKYKYTARLTDKATGSTRKVTIIRDDNTMETRHEVMRLIALKLVGEK